MHSHPALNSFRQNCRVPLIESINTVLTHVQIRIGLRFPQQRFPLIYYLFNMYITLAEHRTYIFFQGANHTIQLITGDRKFRVLKFLKLWLFLCLLIINMSKTWFFCLAVSYLCYRMTQMIINRSVYSERFCNFGGTVLSSGTTR